MYVKFYNFNNNKLCMYACNILIYLYIHTDIFIKKEKIKTIIYLQDESRLFETKIDDKLVVKINQHVVT